MPTRSVEKSQNLKSPAPKKGSAKSSTRKRRQATSAPAIPKKPLRSVVARSGRAAAAKTPAQPDEPRLERLTKQERLLILLNHPKGASIAEMMQATNWQQHSVRGFLAGTVKKKLGFALTSLKPDDGVRRYRIEMRRGH
jgi:Protein of unknown function (DUF3489)